MGRHAYTVAIAALVSLALAESSFCQVPPQQPNGGAGHGRTHRRNGPGAERWRAMPPAERQRFQSNAERWAQMPPEQQRILREREAIRRQRVQREADVALRQSGLELEAERREQYERRYLQERRRIEQALRQELEERRQRELAPVVELLKREFSEQRRSPSAAPSASAPGGK